MRDKDASVSTCILATAAALLGSCAASSGSHAQVVRPTEPNLIAIVGQRLSVNYVEPPDDGSVRFDAKFKVRVRVLEVVFGEYRPSEMEFISYVHTGQPAFKRDEFGLVYISRYGTELIQQKYLFQPVHRTSTGKWASCGDPYEWMPDVHHHGVQAEPIDFDPPVVFDIKKEEDDGGYDKRFRSFGPPFFRVDNGLATCVMGNYPRELFRVMSEGYLRARKVVK